MAEEKWISRNLKYLRKTIAPIEEADPELTKMGKNIGFIMFMILLFFTTGALLVSMSFVH